MYYFKLNYHKSVYLKHKIHHSLIKKQIMYLKSKFVDSEINFMGD